MGLGAVVAAITRRPRAAMPPPDLSHLDPLRGRDAPAHGSAREDKEGTHPERRTDHRYYGGCLGVCLSEGAGTLHHVETFPG